MNWLSGHRTLCVAQVRSEETDASFVSHSLAPHTSVSSQAASLSMFEKVVPSTQAAHVRSAVGVPAVRRPCAAGHVRQGVHEAWPADALNVPDGQAPHVMSLDDVASAVMYSPVGHGLRTSLHALPSLASE